MHETPFVEIGPVTAFARATFAVLLPFPDLQDGLGAGRPLGRAGAREHGWRCGVVDAVAIRHRAAPAASAYPRAGRDRRGARVPRRPALPERSEAEATLTTHRSW